MALGAVLEAVRVFAFTGVVWFVIYYLMALPLAVYLMFFAPGPGPFSTPNLMPNPTPNITSSTTSAPIAGWGLSGFWLPFCAAAALQVVPLLLYVACLDWRRVIAEADEENSNSEAEDTTENSSGNDSNVVKNTTTGRQVSRAINSTPSPSASAPLDHSAAETDNTISAGTTRLPQQHRDEQLLHTEAREDTPLLESESASANARHISPKVSRMFLRLLPVLAAIALIMAAAILLRAMRPQLLSLIDRTNTTHTPHNCTIRTNTMKKLNYYPLAHFMKFTISSEFN